MAHQLLAWCPSNEGARSPASIGVVETSIAEDYADVRCRVDAVQF
ncbi:hypothetical protein JOE40_002153 [Arthrobacter sp. PvP102]|nr:hypothetical protein [Arthrobacter sp. PvP103]MBP1237644.1 hypothetical protein [Arthrobacter sp. PvP102]